MFQKLLNTVFRKKTKRSKQGLKGIIDSGHRQYVGGRWEELGKLQFDFLLSNGLQPEHTLLDIACGSLRAGRHFIAYLNTGNYLGIEKESKLLELALEQEIEETLLSIKKPEFVVSYKFEFHKFTKTANFALAQSLFTHLPPKAINLCFDKLRKQLTEDGVFFATYFLKSDDFKNPKKAHARKVFRYTLDQMIDFGKKNDWLAEVIGDWGHPRGQQMVKYTLKSKY